MAEAEAPPEPDRIAGVPHPREARHLIGQETAERAFLDALDAARLHHAWLLRGPQGIGKATLAYRIARALIAMPPPGGGLFGDALPAVASLDAPDDCPVRARILAGSEPRLMVLRRTPQPTTGRMRAQITVDDVRAVRRFLQLSAADGGWRVVIVDAADEMNRNAANALLKYLEEPPPNTAFLLISHAPGGLLPTIRSRCRTLDLEPLGPEALATVLDRSDQSIPADAMAFLAELSAGSAGQALDLVALDGQAVYAALVGLFGTGERIDRARLTELAERCAGRDADGRYRLVMRLTQILLARVARAGAAGPSGGEAARGERALLAAISVDVHDGALWAETLARIAARARHAAAVNLDPAQTVLDTWLDIDTTLARVRRRAA